jgi:hypothetical protein
LPEVIDNVAYLRTPVLRAEIGMMSTDAQAGLQPLAPIWEYVMRDRTYLRARLLLVSSAAAWTAGCQRGVSQPQDPGNDEPVSVAYTYRVVESEGTCKLLGQWNVESEIGFPGTGSGSSIDGSWHDFVMIEGRKVARFDFSPCQPTGAEYSWQLSVCTQYNVALDVEGAYVAWLQQNGERIELPCTIPAGEHSATLHVKQASN